MQIETSTEIMSSKVFIKDDLCALSKEYALGAKNLKNKRNQIKESNNIHDMKDTDTLSSMRSEMEENKRKIDKHVTSVMLQSLMKLDEEHERRTAVEFTKLLSESDKGTLIRLMNIAPMEFKVLELYQESQDFNYIDEKLGWSAGASFKTYITLDYKIKRFFNKEFLNIYEDFLEDKSDHEAKTITKLHKFRKKCIEEDLFKPRDIKIPRIMDGSMVTIKEAEMVTLLKLEGGESYTNVSKDLGWPEGAAWEYHNKVYKRLIEEKKKNNELTVSEKKVEKLTKLGFTVLEISNELSITVSAVYSIRKRIKKKCC